MIALANWLYDNEYFETDDQAIRTSELKDTLGNRLEYAVDTGLDHLEEINVVNEVSQGGGQFILHERTERAFFDTDDGEMLSLFEEELSRFLADLREQEGEVLESGDDEAQSVADGGKPGGNTADAASDATDDTASDDEETDKVPTTLRAVAAAALDVEVPVEDALTEPADHIKQIVRFDDVATAIIESDEVDRGRQYEPMGWRNAANKWALTMTAKARKENESLPG